MIPDTLDLLTISVRAGLGFDAALGKVVEKLKGPLSDEFRRALAEVRVGKARRDALRDIVAAHRGRAADQLHRRDHPGRAARRVDLARCSRSSPSSSASSAASGPRSMAAKAPIKMLFPLVGCIFPSLFIVILGPAIILIIVNLAGV